jgi:virginiamycin A acetyltransferase
VEMDNYIAGSAKVDASAVLEVPVRLYGSVTVREGCKIGQFTFINSRSTLHLGTQVGRYCSIGKNVDVGAYEHPMQRLSTSPVSYNMLVHFPNQADLLPQVELLRPMETRIGNDVWIGTNVLIRRGVTIGDGAVIAAGAFVNRDVAPYEIVGGLPIRSIGYRFPAEIIADLVALAWWELPVETLADIPFDNIEAAIERLRVIRGGKAVASPAPQDGVEPAPVAAAPPQAGSAKHAALQAAINAIPAHRPADPDGDARFFDLLRSKLVDSNAPSVLLDMLTANRARLRTDYDPGDPLDAEILNSKLAHVIAMVGDRADADAPISPAMERTILAIMSSKG